MFPSRPEPAAGFALGGATPGQTVAFDGAVFVPVDFPVELPSGVSADGLVHNGTSWVARRRVFYGTAVARDAVAAPLDGDLWVVTSGPDTGTVWVRLTAWQQAPVGANAAAIRTILGLGALAVLAAVDPATHLTQAVPVANGGTGAANAADARSNLGLGALATLGLGLGLTTSGANAVVDTTEIATRAYAEGLYAGFLYKGKCRVAVAANVASLSGPQTLDGVAVVAGERVVLTGQSDPTENGPWVVAAGAWTRPSPNELLASAAFPIDDGTYEGHVFYIATNDPITPGVTALLVDSLKVNVSIGQIVDAGTAGGAVLAAETRAEGREEIGVQDGPRELAANYATASSEVPDQLGLVAFDPAAHAVVGRTTELTLAATGRVTGAGLTGTLELVDVSNNVVASIDWTETALTAKTAAVALPVADVVYRLRFACAGSADPDVEYAEVGGWALRVSWSTEP